MPLLFVRNDITKMEVDAIVNAANPSLLGGGGVDGAIHRAAGPTLLAACRKLGGCPTGQARLTRAGRLPCRYVIHTVGPVWHGGSQGEAALLRSCYTAALTLAAQRRCSSVAFPLISSGVYGYPRQQAVAVAVAAITDFLQDHDLTVYLVFYDRDSCRACAGLYDDIAAYIDDRYVDAHTEPRRRPAPDAVQMDGMPPAPTSAAPAAPAMPTVQKTKAPQTPPAAPQAAPFAEPFYSDEMASAAPVPPHSEEASATYTQTRSSKGRKKPLRIFGGAAPAAPSRPHGEEEAPAAPMHTFSDAAPAVSPRPHGKEEAPAAPMHTFSDAAPAVPPRPHGKGEVPPAPMQIFSDAAPAVPPQAHGDRTAASPVRGLPSGLPVPPASLEEALRQLDESFSEMLLRLIDEKGMTDTQCYKRANIDRKLFSKIRSNRFYKPSKPTVLAFAVALQLTLPQTQLLLQRAGFALTHANKADIIVEFFIQRGNCDIFEINEALFAFDQCLLGG